jgi:S1-C subfamily serine protease
VQGTLLPGTGFGIDAIEEGSPAEEVGLQPGMVITVCNGIPLVGEADLPRAIEESGGVLELTVLQNIDGPAGSATIQMRRIASQSY